MGGRGVSWGASNGPPKPPGAARDAPAKLWRPSILRQTARDAPGTAVAPLDQQGEAGAFQLRQHLTLEATRPSRRAKFVQVASCSVWLAAPQPSSTSRQRKPRSAASRAVPSTQELVEIAGEDELLDPPGAHQPLEAGRVKRAHGRLVQHGLARAWAPARRGSRARGCPACCRRSRRTRACGAAGRSSRAAPSPR